MKELITTLCRGQEIRLLWQPEEHEIQLYMDQGFVPVEMAEGTVSYVDFRKLDHHNCYSGLPSACVTALDFYGDLKGEQPAKLMVNHTDSDSVMTGLTLLGLLPLEFLRELNPEIGLLDTEPIGADYGMMKRSEMIRLWKRGMASVKRSGWSWFYGLNLWLDLYEHPQAFKSALSELNESEAERIKQALADYSEARFGASGRVVLIAPSRVVGNDVQFFRENMADAHSLEGWRHWCIIAHVEHAGNVMLSCPNRSVAELAFGEGGLKNVFPLLPKVNGKSWGGRESIGGSPRGETVPPDMLEDVLQIVDGSLRATQSQSQQAAKSNNKEDD